MISVYKDDNNRWCAQVSKNGITNYLGTFPTREAARNAYRTAKGETLKSPAKKLAPYAGANERSPALQSLDTITDNLRSVGISPTKDN